MGISMKRCGFLLLLLGLSVGLFGQAKKPVSKPKPSAAKTVVAKTVVPVVDPATTDVLIETELGSFTVEPMPDIAPKHAANFVKLAQSGYYNGSAFHRIVANGIIQGGDPLLKNPKTPRLAWGSGGLNLLQDEFSNYKHSRGTLSAVRLPGKPNSGGNQFFVCVIPQPVLDGQYSAFARIVEGIEVVDKISQQPVAPDQLAAKPIKILSAKLVAKQVEPFVGASVDELRRNVVVKTTLGTLKIKMEPDWAPETVRNFLKLAQTGWYKGTTFHRIIKDFMFQGGLPESRVGSQSHPADRWVRLVKDEFRSDIKHTRGVISMAHSDQRDSALTSFFIMFADASNLDGQYAAFGKVIEGLDVIDQFAKQDLQGEKPVQTIQILDVTVE
jgi:cyclophilin family peptidyl-prolyl cis-trans isomerase